MSSIYAKQCECGAVTVQLGNDSWSMSLKAFRAAYPDVELEGDKYYQCDHCVNHWGIDLCECGSGKKPENCCGAAMQTLGKPMKKGPLWRS